ncbi:MAG: hypothetical protein KF724_03140 [Phycisphaeraceae bacterium]|nr:hypothetical protein [Phycisphaeraceae bacterium]
MDKRLILGAGVGALALFAAGAANAGSSCLAVQSSPILNNDDCLQAGAVANYVDPNGGCNFTPAQLQDVGVLSVPGLLELTGTVGTFVPFGGTAHTSRDLDWYTFTLNQGATVSINARMNNADGEGGAPGFVSSVLFLIQGGSCPAGTVLYGAAGSSCNHIMPQFILPAGTYTFVITTPFEVDSAVPFYNCPAEYQVWIDAQPTPFGPICAAATAGCAEVHAGVGCDDFTCCEAVCGFDSNCCFVSWDQNCVDLAVSECGYFIYSCDNPGPANDCAFSPILVQPGDVVFADTTGATTDGPNGPSSLCAVDIGLDIWYVIKAPSNGELSVDGCNLDFDSVIAVYDIGTDLGAFDPSLLGTYPSACADDTCGQVAGPSRITIVNANANHYYLVRIGSWFNAQFPPESGSGNVAFDFDGVIFNTGSQRAIRNQDTGALTNLGLSSGNLGGANTRRWSAVAFTVPQSDSDYVVTKIIGKGFIPAGWTVSNLGWVIWNRLPGNPAPTAADQVAAGLVPLPVNYDEADDDAANAAWPIVIPESERPVLPPGDYYLTLYGDNGGPNELSQWAWFLLGPDGVPLLEGGLHGWRSATAAGGFQFFLLPAVWAVQVGDDPNWLYNNAFRIIGQPVEAACVETPDQSGNGCVDGADIAIVLGNWSPTTPGVPGAPGDVNCDGFVSGADIAVILGAWLTGPNCP